jgi:hypothetical protein
MISLRATVAALALLLAGCGARMVTIEVPLKAGGGDKDTHCFDYASDVGPGWFAAAAFQEAEEARQDHVDLTVPAGALLWASVDSNSGGKLEFPFFLRDSDATRIFLGRHPSMNVGYLGGNAIYVDVSDADAAKWLLIAPKAELATVRSIGLSGDPRVDVPALERLSDRPLAVAMPRSGLEPPAQGLLLAALEQAKPLALMDPPDLSSGAAYWDTTSLARLASISSLTHLGISGTAIPDLSRLPRLRCLKFSFPRPGSGDANDKRTKSLAPLAHLTNLEHLELDECEGVEDLSPLANLGNLKSLTLGKCDSLTALGPIASLTNLDTLCLGDNHLQDLSGLDRLAGLRRLALFPLPPPGVDLSPIYRLKKLQFLLVNKSDTDNRPKDIAAIRQALPNVKVVGVCMGSAWALLVLALGAGAGLAVRRLRRPSGSAA